MAVNIPTPGFGTCIAISVPFGGTFNEWEINNGTMGTVDSGILGNYGANGWAVLGNPDSGSVTVAVPSGAALSNEYGLDMTDSSAKGYTSSFNVVGPLPASPTGPGHGCRGVLTK